MVKSPLAFIIAILVLSAGCSTFDDSTKTRGTIQQSTVESTEVPVSIPVKGNSTSVDVNRTFIRVQQVTGATINPPERVTFESSVNSDQFTYSLKSHPFFRLLGAESSSLQSNVSGSEFGRSITISYTDQATSAQIEHVLAHEFAHVVQRRTGFRDAVLDQYEDEYAQTTDGQLSRESIIEGSAEYVAREYDEEYIQGNRSTETVPWEWNASSLSASFYWAPYRYGAQYADRRLDSPGQLNSLRRSPPRTTEQVLHGYSPAEEPPIGLWVRSNDSASDWGLVVQDTVGELTVRLVLATELDESTAVRGSSGWGNDEVLTYHDGNSSSFVWVTRWDDAENSTAFKRIFERYLFQRASESGDGWHDGDVHFRVERSHEDTVVILAGADSFVSNTTIETDGRDVVIVPPGQ